MFRIVEKEVHLEFPPGHHLHGLVCQIPNQLGVSGLACKQTDPEAQWVRIRSIFELAAEGIGNPKKLHFLFLPEAAMPAARVANALDFIDQNFQPNTVTLFGVEHITLAEYRQVLVCYQQDNQEALASVDEDLEAGDIAGIPVNWVIVAIKEADGRLRIFLQAKSHPFGGEETLDSSRDLYRGKIFPLFRSHPTGFNFMAVICLDYIYRDLYQSNISAIIDQANRLYFETRQRLDLLAVLQCNPKPEHQAFRDVINGFYGEYLAYTPGVRDSITVFCNSSAQTSGLAAKGECTFGHSAVIIHSSHKLAFETQEEFRTDDFGGLPVCRLRFGADTRLYLINLPVFYEIDPRTTRAPLKIHSIFRPDAVAGWVRLDRSTSEN